MRVFGCFLLFHMLFDFYFQSNKMADEKESNRIALGLHCLIYAVGAAATVTFLFEASVAATAASFTVFALSHWFIDGGLRRKIAGLDLSPVGSFFDRSGAAYCTFAYVERSMLSPLGHAASCFESLGHPWS